MEAIDLSGMNRYCDLGDLIEASAGASAGTRHGVPISCGGWVGDPRYYKLFLTKDVQLMLTEFWHNFMNLYKSA